MKKIWKYLLLFIIANFTKQCFCLAQNPNIKRAMHWYFGQYAGLDFTSGFPVADTSGKVNAYEGCATISDTSGKLLFYMDGSNVWNRLHQLMPNGTGITGCQNYTSAAQHLIVPHPANDSLFYLFTNDCAENQGAGGFNYAIVDLSLDGGFGDVTSKNNVLFAPSTEGAACTRIRGDRGYWVTTHEYSTNRFFTYRIDSTGLDTVPIISPSGIVFQTTVSYLRFSPNGKKLAATYPITSRKDQVFEFDDSLGVVFNPIVLRSYVTGVGPCFSPDNSKLYIMSNGNVIEQFCLVNYDSISVNQSYNLVINTFNNGSFGAIMNGYDGKLYIATRYNPDSISTIEYPNLYGSQCKVNYRSVALNGRQSRLGLPNFISSYFYTDTSEPEQCDSIINNSLKLNYSLVKIYPNPASRQLFIEQQEGILPFKIILSDYLGRILIEREENNKTVNINIESFYNGIYFISITNDKYQINQSIIINH